MFFKIGVLKHFAIFTGKHVCWSLFLIKLQASRIVRHILKCVWPFWRPAALLKRDSNTRVFNQYSPKKATKITVVPLFLNARIGHGKGPSIKYVRKIFQKTNISCAYQGVRNASFSENFAYVLNGWSQRNGNRLTKNP